MRRLQRLRGQATLEYAILTASVIIPLVFGIIFLCQMLWVWHSLVELTRDGARYAATHCWQSGATNVVSYMRANVPVNIDQAQFQSGAVDLVVTYFSRDPTSGALTEFTCDSECSPSCVPDTVNVQIANYEFRGFFSYLKLQPVASPSFQTTAAIEGAGCDPEQGVCTP